MVIVAIFFLSACGTTRVSTEPLAIPAAGLGYTFTRETDNMMMVYVPAGTFNMGRDANYTGATGNVVPIHSVTLSGYWIDMYPVTNSHYAQCVAAGICSKPSEMGSFKRETYYGDDQYKFYPVVFISWKDADIYCRWAGVKLPTEAQWEFAARGPKNNLYPWGNYQPLETQTNYGQNIGDTSQVNAYPDGRSWVGAFDMAGNVWEYTGDWYDSYPSDPAQDPTGPRTGTRRVARGGSFNDSYYAIMSTSRNRIDQDFDNRPLFGFRCVVEAQDK